MELQFEINVESQKETEKLVHKKKEINTVTDKN